MTSSTRVPSGCDVAIVGAGVVGLAAAWRLAEAGVRVCVLDAVGVGGSASSRNAGLIDAPGWGSRPDLDTLLKMGSLALYERLTEDGFDLEFERGGRLCVALDESEVDPARELADRTPDAVLLDGDEARRVEPALGPAVRVAVWTPGSAHADPVAACAALAATAHHAGATIIAPARVVGLDGRAEGGARLTLADGSGLDAEAVLVTAGAWTASVIDSLDPGLDVPVTGVVGQMWATAPCPAGTVRTTITAMESTIAWSDGGPALTHDTGGVRRTRHLYGRQRRNGEIVFGGDRVPIGRHAVGGRAPDDDPAVDDAGITVNHAHAASVLPVLAGLPPVRTWSGIMPFTPDGVPVIGAVGGVPGLFVAGGLASSGFNRGPMTGWLVADLMLGRAVPPEVARARPDRFAGNRGPARDGDV